MINITATHNGDVISQNLQGDNCQQRRQQAVSLRYVDDFVDMVGNLRVTLAGYRHHPTVTRPHFGDI